MLRRTQHPPPKSSAPELDRPVHVISQELKRHEARTARAGTRSSYAAAHAKPKPQLLMAVGLGFVLGRAFDFVNGRSDHGTRSGKTQTSDIDS